MPNFLGTSTSFAKEFAKPITKGQLPGASAEDIGVGMEKLKVLHQQVLPFILRREKNQVLKELPPKTITIIPCDMSEIQRRLYRDFCAGPQAKKSLDTLQRALRNMQQSEQVDLPCLGSDTLKALLFLRLLCTHPSLVSTKRTERNRNEVDGIGLFNVESSGKLLALSELLRDAGIHTNGLMAADNDASLIYCESNFDDDDDADELSDVLNPADDIGLTLKNKHPTKDKSKCLIFAQFTHSLDVVEELLLKRHMPSVRYLRLDGRVPAEKRSDLVDLFNRDDSIGIMLLTTRIGSLGLNLTGTSVFETNFLACRAFLS
jgi:TATA-binding protein-associated factor